MDSFTVRKRFRKEIEAEIIRRLQTGSNLRMGKSEIEEIGVAAGMRREYVTLEFRNLAGDVWCGLVYPEDGCEPYYVDGPIRRLPSWVAIALEPRWFHRKEKI